MSRSTLATLVPGARRATHSYGLGGLFGDTVMGAVADVDPADLLAFPGQTDVNLAMAVGMLALGVFVLGFTKSDVQPWYTRLSTGSGDVL